MKLNVYDFARMIDLSLVRTRHSYDEYDAIIKTAIDYNFICTFALPSHAPYLIDKLKDYDDIMVGSSVGFPAGATTSEAKVFETTQCLAMGCDEIDMVMNLGWLISGREAKVLDEMKAVVEAAQGMPVKVIIESMLLSDDEIRLASELIMKSKATYIKTGTGWPEEPTTYHHIEIIKETVGDDILVKASGGVRTLEELVTYYKMGVSRFGVGYSSCLAMLKEIETNYPDGIEI